MNSLIASLANIEVEEVYNEDDIPCQEPLDCLGCGFCRETVDEDNNDNS